MQPRQGIVTIFSSFLQFEADQFSDWRVDLKLRRSMENALLQVSQNPSENFWVVYWYKIWQTQASILAAAHISAYLQEVCYWVSRKIATNFTGSLSVADLFQIAIVRVDKILAKFNPQYGSNLKGYAELAFKNIIKDTLRQRQEADICTDWALLHKLSRKRLLESLQNAAFKSPTIESYILAWECFQELYTAENTKVRKLVKPNPATWQAMTNLYNSQRLRLGCSSSSTASPHSLEEWLSTCATSVRAFLYPTFVSTDVCLNEDGSGNFLDILPADLPESLLTEIIAQEETANRQEQQTELNTVLIQAIAALDMQSQKLLKISYNQQITQQQIAQQLEMKQYTVSRRLSSIKRCLLLTITQWSLHTLHISPTPNVVENISISLEEWLKVYYYHGNQSTQIERP
ncbi:sigma-70 family RNA polymerase sigma factor [Nostoc sp. 'Peltigera membranacea cyanobiont' 232]|uniref:sigma-70 family RNA polymerase sigma factor n=1 Tax=Nostoc sp. 'Peltigera membranacea cyanobiont' 232 TaxID=2014531 RepID=UPI000B9573D9|nr:sigma-70 family RNA polymerase sigma factor [Nostoc sp. 'Peltigera membranacea cyanobiont' 232]OYE01195.1 group 3/4 sigma-70 RNA polymerase sigma factor [Nostoc sp. 'Peltigera membranacea cyanobiont' 232]